MKTFDRELAKHEQLQDAAGNKVKYYHDSGTAIEYPIFALIEGQTVLKAFNSLGLSPDGTQLYIASKKFAAWVNVYRTDKKSFHVDGPFGREAKALEAIPEPSKKGDGRGQKVEYLATKKVYEETV